MCVVVVLKKDWFKICMAHKQKICHIQLEYQHRIQQ
jgi:hypothetical protein